MGKWIRLVGVAAVATGAGVTFSATAAAAQPAPAGAAHVQAAGQTAVQAAGITCFFQLPDNSVGVRCNFPGPTLTRYRAWANCTNGRHPTGTWFTVNSGSWSWANCGVNAFPTNWGFDLA